MRGLALLSVSCLASLLVACGTTEGVTIKRDSFGTPQVYASSNYGVYYGYGYALAEDRLFQMEMLKRTVNGEVAAVMGRGYLELDKTLRTQYDRRSITGQIAALQPKDREILHAYAEGINAYIRKTEVTPDFLPAEFGEFDFQPAYWTEYDSAMVFVGAIAHRYSDFNSELDNAELLQQLTTLHGDPDTAERIFNASKWLLDDSSPTTVPAGDNARNSAAINMPKTWADTVQGQHLVFDATGRFVDSTENVSAKTEQARQLERNGYLAHPEFAPASNFWSVSAGRFEGANGGLVNGPQFDFSVPSYAYGIGLHGGDFDTVGNTLLGLPCLLFAHNNRLAWGSTAGMSDQVDIYVNRLNPDNSEQYWHNGKYRDFEQWVEQIAVKGEASPVPVTARRSAQGMVVAHSPEDGVAYSKARTWEGAEVQTLLSWVWLATETNIDDARKRLADIATNINFYYMTNRGEIAYTHGGRYPLRKPGHDSRLPAPGDGSFDWQGFRDYAENPFVKNPEQGYITNWNNRPRTDWISSDLWSSTWSRADRVSLINDEIEARARHDRESLWHVNRLIAYHDISMPFLSPHLEAASATASIAPILQQGLRLLADWDQQWLVDEADQYGAAPALTEAWLRQLLSDTLLDDVGPDMFHRYAATHNPNNPLGASMGTAPGVKALVRNLDLLAAGEVPDYDFFNGQPPGMQLLASLESAIQELTATQGEDMTAWRLSAAPMVWKPVNFRGVPQTSEHNSREVPGYMNRGSENNLFIATDEGFISYDVIPPGQSGHTSPAGKPSDHSDDQMSLFSNFKLKPVPATAAAITEATVTETQLTIRR